MNQPTRSPQQSSIETLTLQSFVQTLSTIKSIGGPGSTIAACLLLIAVSVDCLLLLGEKWQLEAPLFAALRNAGGSAKIAIPIVLIIQGLALWFGLLALSTSTLHRQIEPSVKTIATFGFGRIDFANRRFTAHYVVMGLIAAGCLWLTATFPTPTAATPTIAMVLDTIMRYALPFVAAWLLTVLIFRAGQDRNVRIALALPVVILIVLSTVVQTSAPDASDALAAPILAPSHFMWFRLTELIFVWVALLGMVHTVISDPANARVFTVTGDNAAGADLVLEYSPFVGAADLSPRKLLFQLGTAQVLAFTREYQAPEFTIIDTADGHTEVPIHHQSITLWNITRFLNSLPGEIKALDTQEYFSLSFTMGTLSTMSVVTDTHRTFKVAVLNSISQIILKNGDLKGLLQRGARDAFEAHVQRPRDSLSDAADLLQLAPLVMTIELGAVRSTVHDELDAWIKQYSAYRVAAQERINVLSKAQTAIRNAVNTIVQWRPQIGRVNKTKDSDAQPENRVSLESAWYHNITDEIGAAVMQTGSRFTEVDKNDVGFLLRTIGLRFNEIRIATTGKAEGIVRDLESARAELSTQLERYNVHYEEALRNRTVLVNTTAATQAQMSHEQKQLLLQTLFSTPGAVNAKILPELVRALGLSGPPGAEAQAQTLVNQGKLTIDAAAPATDPADHGSPT